MDFAFFLGLRWVLEELILVKREKDSKGYILPPKSASKGADDYSQDGHYDNALQVAIYRGHEEIVKLLVKESADVNAQSSYFGRGLVATSRNSYQKIVKFLVEKGADVNAQDVFSSTAF